MKTKDINIIGAGPSGLIAAIQMAEAGHNISIIDKRYTYDRRNYVNGVLIKNYLRPYLKQLKESGEVEIPKQNSRNGFNSNTKKLLIDDLIERASYENEILIQLKEVELILNAYVKKFYPDIKIIRGVTDTNISFDHEKNKMIMEYKTNDRSGNVEFDTQIYAAGSNTRGHAEFLAKFPQFAHLSHEELQKHMIQQYEYEENHRHTAVIMAHLGREKDIKESTEYDHEALYNDMKKLGYATPPSLVILDKIGKHFDFKEGDQKNVIAIMNLPGKNKVSVVGALPEGTKDRDGIENWAKTILKHKFPNTCFNFCESNFVLDYQGEKRLQRLDELEANATTEEAKKYWKQKKEKFGEKISELNKSDPERLSRKNRKDDVELTFYITAQHVKYPTIRMENGGLIIFIGNSFMSPDYRRGDGIANAIKEVADIKKLNLETMGDFIQSAINSTLTSMIHEKVGKKMGQFTESSRQDAYLTLAKH